MAINTYFKNIADAIREKTGGSALITPGQMPEEIRSITTGGSGIDLSAVDYIAFIVRALRVEQSYIQLCKIELTDQNDNIIPFASGKNCGVWGGQAISSNTEGVTKIWDNLPVANHNKTIISKSAYQNFYLFYCRFTTPQDFTSAYKWKWYTAEDEPARDPITFGLMIANGTEEEGILKVVDFVTNNNTPTARNVVAYEGLIR